MADPYGNLLPEEYQQQQAINRQQQLASMLMQNNQQPQGQMISGRYVAPSFFQNIAPLVNAYVGKGLLEEGDVKAAKLAEAIRGRNATEMQDILNKQFGSADYRPAITPEIKRDDMGNVMPNIENQVGVAPNKQAAFMAASQARGPQAQALFQTLLANKLAPKVHTVAQGGALVQENDQGGITPLYQNPKEPEHPASYKEYLLAQKDPINPFKGSYTDYQIEDANRRRPITNVTTNVMPEQKTFENTQKLRQNFNQEPIYKGFQEVKSAYSQINDGLNLKSPAGDLAAATKFMKILDPGSVVRESELAMAMKATGALDRLQNYAQNVVKGTKLTPSQREDFRKLSTDFYNSSATQYNQKQSEYTDIAKRYNLNPQDVTSAPIKLEGTSNTQYATNPKTKERIMSNDGGKTWSKAP